MASERILDMTSCLLALEPRIMYDAAGVAEIADCGGDTTHDIPNKEIQHNPDDASSALNLFDEFVPPIAASELKEIIIIDSNVQNVQQLVQGASEDARIIVLDPSKDGLAQIDALLSEYRDLDAIHIVSHGNQGSLNIGDTVLNLQGLEENISHIENWGKALDSNGDILLYGCDVAKGPEGQVFVNRLSELTQADVAASIDPTGHDTLGGDWDLETHTGSIETAVAFSESTQEEYLDTLEEPPVLISVDSTGTIADGSTWAEVAVSMDGQWVAFGSSATNLVAGDTNGQNDIFLHNTTTGQTVRVSLDSGGAQALGGGSYNPSISTDGRYVVFDSYATNLVAGDTNATRDIFVHDTQTGNTSRVSVDSGGVQGNSFSSNPSISADGRYVVFTSSATNLVAGDTNATEDIFVHDIQTGNTSRVSVDSTGTEATGGSSYNPLISANGRYVVFTSSATNLVAGDTNGQSDIFVHDIQTGNTSRVSVDSTGTEATGGGSYDHSISADGRYVAFDSSATNLVAGDTNAAGDIFVHDTQTGNTSRVSVDSGGVQGNGWSYSPSISADGRYVVFTSSASNLIPGDINGLDDTFIHDRQTGSTELASTILYGASLTSGAVLTGDGTSMVLSTNASLVPADVNSMNDIYLLDFNDAPVLTAGSTTTYTENSSAVVIDNSILLTDDDTDMVGATITISSNFIAGDDILSFTPVGSITGVWDEPSATLTLSGVDTIANYQAALRSVVFESSSDTPDAMGGLSRTISFEVDDGVIVSPIATSTVNIIPVNDIPSLVCGAVTGYIENDPPTVIDSSIVLADDDSADMTGATIRISTNYIEGKDSLNFTPVGGITGVWDAPSATLTLSGVDSIGNYQIALRSVTFVSSSNNPAEMGGLSRTISFDVDDGLSTSPVVTSTLNITAVNDPFLAPSQPFIITVYAGSLEMEAGGLLADRMAGVVDADGDVLGIAVIDADNTNGFLQYTIDGGTTWNNFGSVSDSNATLLAPTPGTRLRFVPNNSEYIGTVNMNYRLWDQTIGSSGQTGVDTSVTGGMYPYSLNFRTIIFDIQNAPLVSLLPPTTDNISDLLLLSAPKSNDIFLDLMDGPVADQSDNTGLISEFLADAAQPVSGPPSLEPSILFPEAAENASLESSAEELAENGDDAGLEEPMEETGDEEDISTEGEEQVLEENTEPGAADSPEILTGEESLNPVNGDLPLVQNPLEHLVEQGLSGQLAKEGLKTQAEAKEILKMFEDVYDLLQCK